MDELLSIDAGSAHNFEPDLPQQCEEEEEEVDRITMPRNRLRHNQSFDSIFDDNGVETGDGQSISSNLSDNLPLIPHNTYNPEGTNDVYSVILIINAALGAGLLNFPKAFDNAGGLALALIVQVVLLVFIIVALQILAYASDRPSSVSSTIEEVMGACFGRIGRIVTSLCVVIYCFGTTVTFLIMIGDQYDRIFASLIGPDFCLKFYMNRDFTMGVTGVLVILPLCFSKRIDFLRIPSLIGVTAIFYLVGLIAYEYAYGGFVPGEIKHWPNNWTDVFLVVPDICFGYQCHVSVIPIYSCMKHRKLKHFAAVSMVAIFVCALSYSGAASLGYLTFGSKVNVDILLSYDGQRPEVIIGILAMALKTVFTYPILLFCGREAMKAAIGDVKALFRRQVDENDTESTPSTSSFNELVQRIAIVLVWFILSIVFAILVPNIGEVISLLGCLAAFFIFVFPGGCLISISLKSDPSLVRRSNRCLLVLGVIFVMIGTFIFGVVLTQDIQSMVKLKNPSSSSIVRALLHDSQMQCQN